MTKNIKGITIELDGDTSGLTQALKKVDNETKSVQTELKQVERLLKLDPSNVELLSQKQKLLGDAVDNTSKRLDALKQAQSEVQRQFQNGEIGEEAFRKFQREIIATEGKLNAFKGQLKNVNAELDIKADTTKLDKVKSELKDLTSTAKTVGKEIGEGLKKGFEIGAKSVAGLGVAAAGATVGVGAFVESQKEMNMDLARLRTNASSAGFSLEAIEDGFKKVAAVTGEADSAIETMSNLMATDFSENQLAEALDYINGAAIKFSDTLKTEGIADGIQETFATGKAIGPFAELLERSGVNLEEFDAGLAKAAKTGAETDYVLQQLSQLGLASTYEEYQNNNQALQEYNQTQMEMQVKMSDLASQMQPFITSLMQIAAVVLDVILGNKSFSNGLNELITLIKGLAEKLFTAAKDAMPKFIKGMQDALPQVLDTGSKMLSKVIEGIGIVLPKLITLALDIVKKVITKLIDNLPQFLESGKKMVNSLITGITGLLPKIQQTALELLLKLVQTIINNLPQIISVASNIVSSLVSGLMSSLPKMISYLVTTFIPSIIKTLVNADWIGIGKSIIEGLISGIASMAKSLIKSITGVIDDAIGAAKKLLGINSPSRVFMEIGEFTNEGFIKGIESTSKQLQNAVGSVYGSLSSSAQKSAQLATSSVTTSTSTINNSKYMQPQIQINVQGNNLSPAQIARQALNAQRTLAMEWGI